MHLLSNFNQIRDLYELDPTCIILRSSTSFLMKLTESTDWRLQRSTDWVQIMKFRPEGAGPKHTSQAQSHICPLVICCDDSPELKTERTLVFVVKKIFCLSLQVRHKKTERSAYNSVCVVVGVCARVCTGMCVCAYRYYFTYIFIRCLHCHPFFQLGVSFLTCFMSVCRFITHTYRCSHVHKHKGTKLISIFMNVCAIFERCVILKLVYTGIIL